VVGVCAIFGLLEIGGTRTATVDSSAVSSAAGGEDSYYTVLIAPSFSYRQKSHGDSLNYSQSLHFVLRDLPTTISALHCDL
jgi:hypothetical protein